MTRVLDAGLKTQLIISKDNLLRNLSVAIYYYSNYCLSLDWNWSLIQFPKGILSIRSFYPRDVRKLNSSCDVNLCQCFGHWSFRVWHKYIFLPSFGNVLSGRILYKHVPPGLRPSRPTPFSTVAAHVVS